MELRITTDVFIVVSLIQLSIQECSEAISFHNKVLLWLNGMHNTSFSSTSYKFLFGVPHSKDNTLRKFNFCLRLQITTFIFRKLMREFLTGMSLKQNLTIN